MFFFYSLLFKNNLALMGFAPVLRYITRTYLKNVAKGSGQGAGWVKSGAYTLVCEHFEPTRNTALGTLTRF
jgi:hypothetical protein